MSQDNRFLSLLDLLVKGISVLLVLFLIALMILGAPMTMLGGIAMLTAVINWPLMAYRQKRKEAQGEAA